jgi:hypothetical protein
MMQNQPRSFVRRAIKPLTQGAVALAAIACATARSDAPTGTAAQAVTTPTVCNQGASPAPIAPKWAATYTGVRASSDAVSADIVNTTQDDLDVRVDIRGRGLDKRSVVRTIFTGRINRGATQTLTIAPSSFPVQSTGSKSTAVIETTITAASSQNHLVGVKVHSAPLAHMFASGFGQLTLYAEDMSVPQLIQGTPTSLDDLARSISPFVNALGSSSGRVWNGTAMVDVATLPASSADGGSHRIGQTVAYGSTDAGWFDRFMTSIVPFGPSPTGPRFCVRLPGEFIDDGRGESESAADRPASFGSAFIQDKDGRIIWQGTLDSGGCTPRVANTSTAPGNGFGVHLRSVMDASGRKVEIRDGSIGPGIPSGGVPAIATTWISLTNASDVNVQIPAVERHFGAFAALAQVLRIGNVGPGQTSAITVPTGTYTVALRVCEPDVDGVIPTACATDGTLFLGPNPDKTHNVDWKFVVVHEFGHLLQDKLLGTPSVPGHLSRPYSAPPLNDNLDCKHVTALDDRLHCMQSNEFRGATERESYAHFVAANAWNGRSASACTFVYYKSFLDPTPKAAPYPVNCVQKARWLETRGGNASQIAGFAVEWDWMNWKRSVDTAPSNENTNMSDLSDIYKRACGGVSCTNLDPSPAALIAAARNKYNADAGADTPRAIRFSSDINAYGANH